MTANTAPECGLTDAEPPELGLTDAEPPELGLTEPATRVARIGATLRRRKWLIAWAIGVIVYEAGWHMPMERGPVFAIIGCGLVAASSGSKGVWSRVVIDWFPFFVVLYAYDRLRGVADTWLAPHVNPQIDFDRFLFGGVPTVQLQHALYTPGTAHVWDYLVFLTYMSHFIVPIGVAAVLWKVAHDKFRRYVFLFVTLTLAAFLTYLLYPAVPPWMASRDGTIAPTAKIIDDMWVHIGLKSGTEVFSATSHLANPVAAVPSLHTAYPVLIMLFFWSMMGRRRWLLPLYPLAMSFTLIYTAEHFFFDIVVGWLYGFAAYFIGSAVYDAYLERRMVAPSTVATRRQFPWLRNREKVGTVLGG